MIDLTNSNEGLAVMIGIVYALVKVVEKLVDRRTAMKANGHFTESDRVHLQLITKAHEHVATAHTEMTVALVGISATQKDIAKSLERMERRVPCIDRGKGATG